MPCLRYTAPPTISKRYAERNRSSMGRSVSFIEVIRKGDYR